MRSRKLNLTALRTASFALDTCIAAVSFLAAYALVFSPSMVTLVPGIEEKTLAFAAVSAISFFTFSVHRGSWRFVSLPEMLNLSKAAIFAVLVYTIGAFLVSRAENVPRSVPVLTTFLLIAGLAGPRVIYRLAIEGHLLKPLGRRRAESGLRTVLLLGSTNASESFIRAARRARERRFAIAGILDESSRSPSMQGVRIYGGLAELPEVVRRLARQGVTVTELVVAEDNPSRQRLSQILEVAISAGLKTTRISNPTETASITSNTLIDPKPIELSDLLGRPEVKTDIDGVANLISGKIVLATGAGGSIGSELVRQIAQFQPRRLVLTDHSEHNAYLLDTEIRERFPDLDLATQLVSVRDRHRLNSIFERYKPEVVFHAAALKHVPLVEENPLEGIKTNVLGTRNTVDAAVANGASTFIMISTDKAVNPTNVMGATKRAAEIYCQAMDLASERTRFKTVRFGNVLGSNGSVVPRFKEQITAGGPVTVTHPQIVRYFMTIPEAVRLVLHASARALKAKQERGKIMVLNMGKPVRIVDLAERMIQLAGFRPGVDIDIVFTGLRPGEKLYEELFDSTEVQEAKTDDGYVVASPRVIDRSLLLRTLAGLEAAVDSEDVGRALELLRHIVPEYRSRVQEDSGIATIAGV